VRSNRVTRNSSRADAPGFSRRPDLVVVRHDAGRDDVTVRASEVVVAVELASSASQRTGRVAKRSDYAAAGIPHYWIVDLDPLSVLECRLGADGAYADRGAVTGAFRTLEPFAIEVDLDALV
jgi:Uma2 family endonuclease